MQLTAAPGAILQHRPAIGSLQDSDGKHVWVSPMSWPVSHVRGTSLLSALYNSTIRMCYVLCVERYDAETVVMVTSGGRAVRCSQTRIVLDCILTPECYLGIGRNRCTGTSWTVTRGGRRAPGLLCAVASPNSIAHGAADSRLPQFASSSP